MSESLQTDYYSYTLTIRTLTLSIKFPCKLYLEHAGKTITSEVSPSQQNKCTFNQEASLTNSTDKSYLEIVVYLHTEKGSRYVGGVIQLQ